MRVCIVQPGLHKVTETFISSHAERLPADVTVVHGKVPHIGRYPILSQSLPGRASRKTWRTLMRKPWEWEKTTAYVRAFRKSKTDVVLAEYGPTGVSVMEACRLARIPFVVHFHGYDASNQIVLAKFRNAYRQMFQRASAIVCVSRAMHERLIEIGADPERIHLNAYGIDCDQFVGARPHKAPPVFLAVGRLVEKKAPYLTILAFAKVFKQVADARLRIIGEGQLFGPCRDIASALGIDNAVDFLGSQPHEVVANEMKHARSFVQHSIEASNGDCEGTPVAVLEAGACGLPVVSTRHAGISDVVMDGETGLVVDERDVSSMAECMLRLATDPESARLLGAAARKRVATHYTMEKSICGLHKILSQTVAEGRGS